MEKSILISKNELENFILNNVLKEEKHHDIIISLLNIDHNKISKRILKSLSERDQYILTKCFGLGTEKTTKVAIADDLEISSSAVAGLIKRILKDLSTELNKLSFNIHGELLPNTNLENFNVQKPEYYSPILATRIEVLELPKRCRYGLERNNIEYIYQAIQLTNKDLRQWKNFGQTSINQLKAALKAKKLSLNTILDKKTIQEIKDFLA